VLIHARKAVRLLLIPRFQIVFLLLLMLNDCSYSPERKRVIEEGDFIEPVPTEDQQEVWREIADVKDQLERDFENAELHRRLSVLYRLAGTPRTRLLSSEEIDRAIGLDPHNPILYVEQGLTLIARRFVGEAEAAFVRATQLDPRCFEAWFQLGRMEQYEYLKTMCFPERLEKAINYLEKAYRLNRKDEDTLVSLAFLHSFRRMYQTGLTYGTRAVMYHPQSAKAHLVCGMLYTRSKEFVKAEKAYANAFLLMTEHDLNPYRSIAPLLSIDERELYLSSSLAKQQDWARRLWVENDPTPATDINERRLEHFSRVLIADWTLSDERRNSRGSETDRGAALIRFGLPDKKLFDLGGGTSGGWIVWQYLMPQGSFNLYFNDEFLNGDYHFPISDYYGEASLTMLNTIPQRYEYPIKYVPFPLSVEVTGRRGSEERTRLEFSIAIPDSLGGSKNASWDLLVTFFDAERNSFSRDRLPLKPDSLLRIEKRGAGFLVYNFAMEMLPRALPCTCVVEVVLDKDLRKGMHTYPLDIRDMYGQSLKLSDIKLTLPGVERGCSEVLDPLPSYREGETLCLMYEIYNLGLNERNESRYRLTYSIRKLERSQDQSDAGIAKTLSHIWSSVRGKKSEERPYIESSIEQRAEMRMISDTLQINLGTLEKGAYMLLLKVDDLATGMAVSEGRTFTVTE